MGFTWSLWAAQRINEYQGHVSHYVYVDNLGVASTDQPIVTDAIAQLVEGFDQRGLLLHGSSVGTEVETLGAEVSGALWRTRVAQKRFWLIRQALNGLLRRRRLTGWAVEVLVGHCTFAGLLSRGTLSVFHAVYAFMRKSYAEPSVLWHEARKELETFRGLLIFLESDWALQWNDLVVATDSSLEAGAVATTRWPRSLVAEVGRAQERARFRGPAAAETDGAAGAALEAAGFWRDADGEWRLAEGVVDDDEQAAAWEAGPSFPEVHAAGLASSRWRTEQVQRWRFGEGILTEEARALVIGVRRVAQSAFGAACRQLILSDNMSVVVSFNRSRAKEFALLVQVRRFQAYCLARNLKVSVRWVLSELNPADYGSRVFDKKGAKESLGALLPDTFFLRGVQV
ncbi:unnamed protein product [Prorocentrum cordatum]|uniref:Uncharacterized protein n=1 Tax=Prorocentrum cordatum TaxID=2364126 RepID=A0ABN9WZM0_9DINO|nr:unnamed protein product [Polarella glacialis]